MRANCSDTIDKAMDEFELAVDNIKATTDDQLKFLKVYELHKAKAFIDFAQRLDRNGEEINDAIEVARRSLQKVLTLREPLTTLVPPPLNTTPVASPSLQQLSEEVQGWEQLDLPFMNEKK